LYMRHDADSDSFVPNFFKRRTGKAAEVSIETAAVAEMSDTLRELVEAYDEADAEKVARLKKLWLVYKGEAEFNDKKSNKNTSTTRRLMRLAEVYADNFDQAQDENHKVRVNTYLRMALEIKGRIVIIGTEETPPDDTPPSGGSSGGGAAAARATASSATPSATPSTTPSTTVRTTSQNAPNTASRTTAQSTNTPNAQRSSVNVISDDDRPEKIKAMMERLGPVYDESVPAIVAIYRVLEGHIKTEADIRKLEAYLSSGKAIKKIDEFIGGRSLEQLKELLERTEAGIAKNDEKLAAINNSDRVKRIQQLKGEMDQLEGQYAFYQNMSDAEKKGLSKKEQSKYGEIGRKLAGNRAEHTSLTQRLSNNRDKDALMKAKRKLTERKKNLEEGIAKLGQKEDEESNYYEDKPEKMLGMINLFYAGKKANPKKILLETQKQIDDAGKHSTARKIASAAFSILNPVNLLKPTLENTLTTLVKNDSALSHITPEQITKLADIGDKPREIKAWIKKLEGGEDVNMTTAVPALIGHLRHAVNAGGVLTYLNTFSAPHAKTLLKNLRHRVHEYSIEHMEKSGAKENVDRLEQYFGRYNEIHREADKVTAGEVAWNAAKMTGLRALEGTGYVAIGAGIGAGAAALSFLSGAGLVVGGLATAGGVAAGSAMRVKNEKVKQFLSRSAVRGLAAGGLGVAAMATVPWLTIPALAAGMISPELVRYRSGIGRGVGKVGRGVGRAAPKVGKAGVWTGAKVGRLGWGYVGVVAAAATFGLALFSPRFNSFFGLDKVGLPGMPPDPDAITPAKTEDTETTRPPKSTRHGRR